MARYADRALTTTELNTVKTVMPFLRAHVDKVVTLSYVKRDGSQSSSTGRVDTFLGADRKASVILDTVATKGRPTTINLATITEYRAG